MARSPSVTQADARRRLGLEGGPPCSLSFGGIGLPGFEPAVLARLRDVQFLVPASAAGLPRMSEPSAHRGSPRSRLGYEDWWARADVVVTKPGYGIVTDAIGAGTRLVYTERGDFPEYPILVEGMKRYLPAAYATNEEVRAGRLAAVLERVLAMPFPPIPDLSGAARAAERILSLAG